MPEQHQSFNTWAIVEILGHKRFAGYLTEQTFGVATLIRVDVPETEQPERNGWKGKIPAHKTPSYSKLIGVSSIYCITPCTEEVARKAAAVIEADNQPLPVSLPQLPAPAAGADEAEDFSVEDEDLDDEEAGIAS